MGKKSLFEPTAAPKKGKKEPAIEKTGRKKVKAAKKPVPEPETRAGKKPAADVPTSAPEISTVKAPPADVPLFENDPLVDKKFLLLGLGGFGVLILIILIASIINAGNYYVKETKGAVEVWKGNFSPVGKDRIMILHGTHWDGPIKDTYSEEEVFPFAVVYYLERTGALLEGPVSDDFDRIVYYLDRSLELATDRQFKKNSVTITQVRQSIVEARVLQESGEKESLALAHKKLTAASQALAGLVADMAGNGERAE